MNFLPLLLLSVTFAASRRFAVSTHPAGDRRPAEATTPSRSPRRIRYAVVGDRGTSDGRVSRGPLCTGGGLTTLDLGSPTWHSIAGDSGPTPNLVPVHGCFLIMRPTGSGTN